MSAGVHRFDFQYQLPASLPASLKATRGSIRYSFEACLDIPWRFNEEFKSEFTVVRNDDLNKLPELKLPCEKGEIKTFCCYSCKSGPFTMTVIIPYSGYISGQAIPVTVKYDNQSSVQVKRTKINFIQKITYTA